MVSQKFTDMGLVEKFTCAMCCSSHPFGYGSKWRVAGQTQIHFIDLCMWCGERVHRGEIDLAGIVESSLDKPKESNVVWNIERKPKVND